MQNIAHLGSLYHLMRVHCTIQKPVYTFYFRFRNFLSAKVNFLFFLQQFPKGNLL